MNPWKALFATSVLSVSLLACGSATVGTNGMVSIPKDAAASCGEHCTSIGMSLDSVVIMANTVGCVCRGAKPVADSTPAGGGGASAGGMATLMIASQQQNQRR